MACRLRQCSQVHWRIHAALGGDELSHMLNIDSVAHKAFIKAFTEQLSQVINIMFTDCLIASFEQHIEQHIFKTDC